MNIYLDENSSKSIFADIDDQWETSEPSTAPLISKSRNIERGSWQAVHDAKERRTIQPRPKAGALILSNASATEKETPFDGAVRSNNGSPLSTSRRCLFTI